ncbi:MAG: hypothetical protein H7123_01580, partial [Thermoleophilia bacterium]|nr:hypothetical protein [Thermoleophilia bacterium]
MAVTTEHFLENRIARRPFLLLAGSLALLMVIVALAAVYLGQKSPTHNE